MPQCYARRTWARKAPVLSPSLTRIIRWFPISEEQSPFTTQAGHYNQWHRQKRYLSIPMTYVWTGMTTSTWLNGLQARSIPISSFGHNGAGKEGYEKEGRRHIEAGTF